MPDLDVTSAEIGYLAGLLDGEGSILIARQKQGSRLYYSVQLKVFNTHRGVMDWVQSRCGGAVYERVQGGVNRQQNRRAMFTWHLYGRHAAPLLRALRPLLIVKARQADVALEFLGLGFRTQAPAARADLYERMRGLNQKGIGKQNGHGPATVTTLPMRGERR